MLIFVTDNFERIEEDGLKDLGVENTRGKQCVMNSSIEPKNDIQAVPVMEFQFTGMEGIAKEISNSIMWNGMIGNYFYYPTRFLFYWTSKKSDSLGWSRERS